MYEPSTGTQSVVGQKTRVKDHLSDAMRPCTLRMSKFEALVAKSGVRHVETELNTRISSIAKQLLVGANVGCRQQVGSVLFCATPAAERGSISKIVIFSHQRAYQKRGDMNSPLKQRERSSSLVSKQS